MSWKWIACATFGVATLAVVVWLIPACLRATIGLRAPPPSLSYPDGVEFLQDSAGICNVSWEADDWDRPGPCPLSVHMPTGDLGPDVLGSADGLRRIGWKAKERGRGNDVMSPDRSVTCHIRHNALAFVDVDLRAVAEGGGGPVAVSVSGQRVAFPATVDSVTDTLGPPLPRP